MSLYLTIRNRDAHRENVRLMFGKPSC